MSTGWDGLAVSVSASHTVGRGFASRLNHTKEQNKNGTNCLPAWNAFASLKGRVVCGTVFGDMHLKYPLGSIARLAYYIPVLDF